MDAFRHASENWLIDVKGALFRWNAFSIKICSMQADLTRSSNDALFNEWRAVERAARALEQSLTRMWLLALDGAGDLPSPEQRAQAQQMRQSANDLLALAMSDMQVRTQSNRRH